jgi:cytochrome c biogenesis protein CcdA
MLPAFLGYYISGGGGDVRSGSFLGRLTQGFAVGAAVSGGFAGAFILAAVLVVAGLRSLVRYVPWAAVTIGVGLVALGVALLAGHHLAVGVGERLRPGDQRTYRRMAVFGAAYAVASLSCTLAVFLVVVAQALATANWLGTAAVLVAYGAGAATVLTALSVSTAVAQGTVATSLRRALPAVERLGGVLLVVSGLYLVVYWLPELTGSVPGRSVASISQRFSGQLSDLVDANRGVLGASGLVLLAVGVGLAIRLRRLHRPARVASDGSSEGCCATGEALVAADPERVP